MSPSRSSRRWVLIAGVVLLPVLVFVGAYFLFFTSDSPPPLALSTTTTAESDEVAAPTGDLEGDWTVVEGSEAGYRVREKLADLPAQSDAVGRTPDVIGGFTLARDGTSLLAQGAEFTVDVTTLVSDREMRDNRIRTIGLETNTYPTATFIATGDVVVPAEAEDGGAVATSVTGDLTIHGVTKEVTIPLDVQRTGDQVEVVGSLTFPFSDFGMNPPNVGGFVSVEDDATLEFRLLLSRAA